MSEETAGSPVTPVRVWKYELKTTDRQVIELPSQHQVLHVDEDPQGGGRLALWAAVRPVPDQELYRLEIVIFGTGHAFPVEGDMSHLGSVVSQGFVWHVFRDHANEPDPMARVFGALFGKAPAEKTEES